VSESVHPAGNDSAGSAREYPPGPSALRGILILAGLAGAIWILSRHGRGGDGADEHVTRLGRMEVTARLVDSPEEFPDLGAYRYTYVVEYEVLRVHRQDPTEEHPVEPGDRIFVGHYRPRLPRNQIQDTDWGNSPLGGKVAAIRKGDVHRMALDFELTHLAPSGVLDYCYPPGVNRFFAIWTNPAAE